MIGNLVARRCTSGGSCRVVVTEATAVAEYGSNGEWRAPLRFGFTIYASAFQLFWVELLLRKYFLPWLVGTPSW